MSPGISPVHGQTAGTGGVLHPTTEQKVLAAISGLVERRVRESLVRRGLIFGLIRLRSPKFIYIQINVEMQVTNVGGIRRPIIQTPENRKVGGSLAAAYLIHA